MRDEHLTYTDLDNGKVKIVPENGYKMLCTPNKAYMSEAITLQKNIKYFVGADTCVCCGEPVPEGRMVCPACEERG